MGDQFPPSHSMMGVPSHDRHRSQLGTPPMSSHAAVMVPRNVTMPARTDATIRIASLAAITLPR